MNYEDLDWSLSIRSRHSLKNHTRPGQTATQSTTTNSPNTHHPIITRARFSTAHPPVHEMQVILILAIILGLSQLAVATLNSSLDSQDLYRRDNVIVPRKGGGGGGHGGGGHGSSGGGRSSGGEGSRPAGREKDPPSVPGNAGMLEPVEPIWIASIIAGTVVFARFGV